MKKQQKIEPGLLKDLRSALEVKHFTRRTKETYVYWITRYHTFLESHRALDKMPSKQKVEASLSDLVPQCSRGHSKSSVQCFAVFLLECDWYLIREYSYPACKKEGAHPGYPVKRRNPTTTQLLDWLCSIDLPLDLRFRPSDLKPRGFKFLATHPGWMRTDMGGSDADIHPDEAAEGILTLTMKQWQPDDELYVDYRGQILPGKIVLFRRCT